MERLYYVRGIIEGTKYSAEMTIDENRVKRAQESKGGYVNSDGRYIAWAFHEITGCKSFVPFSSLTIKLIGEPKQQTQSSSQRQSKSGGSFARSTNRLSYCKDDYYCLYCESGNYAKCPNNKNGN